MKKVIALVLVVLMGISIFSGCSRSEDDKGPIIKMYLGSYPSNFDPARMQTDSDLIKFFGLVYEPLTTIDKDGNIQPALAKSWYGKVDKIDGKFKMYFELNATKWSDGTAVSADDVIFAWKRILQPDFESPYASLLYPIENAKEVKSGVKTSDDLGLAAVSDTTLEVTFQQEYDIALFAQIVSCVGLSPLRERIVDKDNSEDWSTKSTSFVCNGPFKIQTMDYDKKIVLERSIYYRLTEDDAFDKYVTPYKIIVEYKTNEQKGNEYQQSLYESGDTYYLGDFTKDNYATFKSQMTSQKMLSSYTYFFNTTNDLLKNAKVRQALSMAIDRNKIVNEILGTGEVAATGYVPHGVFDVDNKTEFRTAGGNLISAAADVAGAKKLLNEAGVSSGNLTLTYRGSNYDTTEEQIATYVNSAWEGLGFTVKLDKKMGITYTTALKSGEFDIIGLDIVGNMVDAFGYLAPFAKYYSGNVVSVDINAESFTPHYTGLQDDSYDALIDSIVFVSKRADRTKLLHDAEVKLIELMPATALYFDVDNYVKSDDLSNVSTSYFGFRILNKTTLKNYLAVNSKIEAANNAATSTASGTASAAE